MRKFVLGIIRGAMLYCQVDDQGYKSSKDYPKDFFVLPSLGPFFMLYTIMLVSSLPYTCRLGSWNSFLSHPTLPKTFNWQL